ncbi:hypothetical protein ACAG26_05870 [Mycobacterium sp. pUA109]|uniref:hypothetical protein n=1 Tax=Mycobacterium sp. pUA109 TaxID=3238982 RepID=UPI00351AD863
MNTVLTPERVTSATQPTRRRVGRWDAVLVAVFAGILSAAGASHPSMWFDEAATVSAAADRSVPELWRLLGHIDAVHGLYYLVMHGWYAVFPVTEFWSRVPSCLAVGGGAAGVVVLAQQFSARRVAVCAGIVFAMLPRMTWAGVEARSYAFAAMAAVWLTVLCVAALRRNRAALWLAYGVAVAAATLLNVFVVLIVAVHGVLARVLRCPRSTVGWWAGTAATAVAAVIPFVLFTQTQIYQVGWISRLNWHNVLDVAQHQYFDNSVPFAVLAGVVLSAAAVMRLTGRWQPSDETRQLLTVCVAWMVLPTGVLLIYSAVSKPIYYPRYLVFTAPAMALLLAVCLAALAPRTRSLVVLLVLFALAAAPNYLISQRGRHAKEGWDYSQVADVVQAQAAPGDCLLVDNTSAWAPGPIRALLAGRPAAFAGLVDPGRGPRGPAIGRLWDGHIAVWLVTGELRKCRVVWTITNHDTTLPTRQSGATLPPGRVFGRTPDFRVLHTLGFRVVQRWQFNRTQVIKSTR